MGKSKSNVKKSKVGAGTSAAAAITPVGKGTMSGDTDAADAFEVPEEYSQLRSFFE